jgi:hypothetical protein
MRICILCDASRIEEARQKEGNNKILTIELSQSGEKPATHYFCTMVVDQKKADKLMAKREFTTMEISEPKDFLEKHNLKMIK